MKCNDPAVMTVWLMIWSGFLVVMSCISGCFGAVASVFPYCARVSIHTGNRKVDTILPMKGEVHCSLIEYFCCSRERLLVLAWPFLPFCG